MTPEVGGSEPFSLKSLVATIGRRKVAILLQVVLVVGIAVGVSLIRPKVFEAEAQVYLSHQDIGSLVTGNPSNPDTGGSERTNETQAQLARVPDIAREVVETSGIPELTPAEFLDDSSVFARPDSDILVFQVRRRVASEAVALATAYARAFTEYRRDLDTRAIAEARRGLEEQLAQLRARGDESSALYADLFGKRQQLRTLETLQTSNAFVVREADEADQIAPRPVRAGVIALLAALVVGVVGALIWEALDSSVRSAEEVSAALGGAALLARLPRLKSSKRPEASLTVRTSPASAAAEPYRILRASLDFVTMGRGYGSILITSAGAGEGKTTTAANLATVLAQGGIRVCLVDLDLRRPAIHKLFSRAATPGFTDVAVGRASVDEALVEIPTFAGSLASPERGPALDTSIMVMPAGSIPPNPGEFVGTPEVADLLARLREQFDAVVIDAPPFLPVVDARVIATMVSGIVVVARTSVLKRQGLDDLGRALTEFRGKVLGIVTIAESTAPTYGYAREYSPVR